jgi:hypothetical protein
MIPKIVELKIADDFISGVDAIAFVEQPAIEIDFLAFNKEEFETYNDYPQKAIENAKRGIELNKENDNKCATQVGKVRAQQLAKGESLSLDTIRRMRAFLIRQRDNYELALDRKDYTACGYISYLLWGGAEALPWAEKKLRQAGEELSIVGDWGDDDGVRVIENEIDTWRLSAVETMILEGVIAEQVLAEKMTKVGEVNGIPYFETIEEARAKSPDYGCSLDSWHEYKVDDKTYYMPCGTHRELFNMDWITDLEDNIESAVLDALLAVGKTDDELITEGYDLEKAVRIDAKETFTASVTEIKNASKPNEPSIDDFGTKHVLYRYKRYDGKEAYSDNSREFCKNVIKAGKWFRKEDINKLTIAGANEGFGLQGQRFYDIFTYKGGSNCQHYWEAFQVPRDEKATDRKRPEAVLDRISDASSLNPTTLANLIAQGRLQFSQEQMDEQQIVATPIMVPNKLISRRDENGDKYYVYFTEDTIKKIAYKFAEANNNNQINHEHDMESMVDKVYLAESWIVDEPKNDKSNVYGYSLPKGSWFGLFKVDNNEYWSEYIKNGKVRGVSVEGMFVNQISKLV